MATTYTESRTALDDEDYRLSQLAERGWTPSMVRDLLGAPDRTTRNPVVRSGAPMRLWLASRVLAAEGTDEFQRRREIAARRSAASIAVAARRREETCQHVAQRTIRVEVIDVDEVARRAVARRYKRIAKAHRYRHLERGDRGDYPLGGWRDIDCRRCTTGEPQTPDEVDDPAVLARWSVNYVRHRLTSYDSYRRGLYGRVGTEQAGMFVRLRVLAAIAVAYPHLAAECARQTHRNSGVPPECVAVPGVGPIPISECTAEQLRIIAKSWADQ